MDSYGSFEVTRITGLTYRQLDHWCRQNLVRPLFNRGRRPHDPGATSGRYRVFTYDDLFQLWIMKTLLDAGLRLSFIADHTADVRAELADEADTWLIGDRDGTVRIALDLRALRLRLNERIVLQRRSMSSSS